MKKEISVLAISCQSESDKKSHLDQKISFIQEKQTEISQNFEFEKYLITIQNNFRLPYASFDRANVFGSIISLFSPREEKYCLPLELIAGNKL